MYLQTIICTINDIRTKVIFKGLALLAFTFFGTQAIAQKEGAERPKPPTYAQLLEEIDSNKDGKLAKSEVKGPLSKDFATIDSTMFKQRWIYIKK